MTICTHGREDLFGAVVNGEMRLNRFGEIVRVEWYQTAVIRTNVELREDEMVVMPNHIHGIIRIAGAVGATRRVVPTAPARRVVPTAPARRVAPAQPVAPTRPNGPPPGSLGAIIGQFKSVVTKQINTLRDRPGVSVWQRNYYEHIIRDEESLHRIRRYISENPAHWVAPL